MKVLIVRTWPDQLNTDSYNVQEIGLAHALMDLGYLCDIVLFQTKGKSRCEKRADGITIYWTRGINILKNGFYPGIRKRMSGYDVIQVHEYDQIQSWLIYTFPAGSRVVLYHGPYYSPFNTGYNAKCSVFDHVFLPFSRKARREMPCITKSPLAEAFLREKGFQNVRSLGVGLDISVFEHEEPDHDKADRMPRDKINILYVGKLEERRNIRFLLQLVQHLVGRTGCIHVTLIGKGEPEYLRVLEPDMHKLIQEGILTCYSAASQQELPQIYRNADMMLFPSNYEIFGMVLMEAMYYGVVCISSKNGGAMQLIEDHKDGIILEGFEEKDWLEQTQKLIDDPALLAKMKNNASEKIKQQYLWQHIAEKFAQVYQTLER